MTAVVYRAFDADGELLYVGVSIEAASRIRNHSARDWFRDVTNITLEHFATRAEALTAEASAIRVERPRFNRSGAIKLHAAALRLARENARITQEQLAHEIDMTVRAYQRWEAGVGQPMSHAKLPLLCTILGVDPDALFDEEVAA